METCTDMELPITMEEVTTLDDCAFTLREVLEYYHQDIRESLLAQFVTSRNSPTHKGVVVHTINAMGHTLHVSDRLLKQYIAEHELEEANGT